VIVVQGSNMAEQHPVGFQWVVEAQLRGAKLIHVDPRFTRTSALADTYVPMRSGTVVAFLGGIVNYILQRGREFTEYVREYTNAATIVDSGFADPEGLDGLFSGWDPQTGAYDPATWQYEGMKAASAAGAREMGAAYGQTAGAHGGGLAHGAPPHTDPTLQHPRCVFQLLKRHYGRYTPEMVETTCGIPRAQFLEVAEALCANSGPERTGAFAYAVGWTQHSIGVQYIRTAAIIQLLLGNIGRPGGGILALRGHASIQGSTDIPTLFNLLPGYIPMPKAGDGDLDDFVAANAAPTGYWGRMRSYLVSLLKAYWGEAATEANDFCFGYLPRVDGDHSAYRTALGMLEGTVKGYFVPGQNPAVGSANSRLHRFALASLEWLVVRDFVETETASFWYDAEELSTGELATEAIPTEVFFLPAAAHVEKDGAFTNTQRLLQWHDKAVEPAGDARSELWFYYHLGRRIRDKLADSTEPRDRPLQQLTWDYPTDGPSDEPHAESVLAEINGWDASGRLLSGYPQLADDGSTACGTWIYCGCFTEGVNQTRRRKPGSEQSWVAPEWAWAWPDNRRLLYNRASADPQGEPWSERKRYVWWDADAGRWTGEDSVDFKKTLSPDYTPPEGAEAEDALSGTAPFVMQADGRGWLYAPNGLRDGPMPTHYEAHESPFTNPLYGQQANPARQAPAGRHNPSNPSAGEPGSGAYPFVMTTYRLTEHHTAGGMSRTVGHLAELQPEMFCEVSPALAAWRGLSHGGWATVITSRTAIEARVMVTDRIAPLTVQGRAVHQVGLPYHWGSRGLTTGDPANEALPIVMDPNVHISEYKTATCDVRPGRRPRGPALRELVEQHAPDSGGTDASTRSEPS
jgi:formate dehydrogenase major subunit